MWEGKGNINRRTDIRRKLMFSEKFGKLKRRWEALHIAGSTYRVQKGELLRDKWNEWTEKWLWPYRRREKGIMTLQEIGIL
jgi:hypothetical protein